MSIIVWEAASSVLSKCKDLSKRLTKTVKRCAAFGKFTAAHLFLSASQRVFKTIFSKLVNKLFTFFKIHLVLFSVS